MFTVFVILVFDSKYVLFQIICSLLCSTTINTFKVDPTQWTDCIIDTIFKNIKIVKIITTSLKSILNLVKLQSLVAKCCKM